MGQIKEKIVDVLNANNHDGISNWGYESLCDRFSGNSVHGSHSLPYGAAELAAQGYMVDAMEELNANVETAGANQVVDGLESMIKRITDTDAGLTYSDLIPLCEAVRLIKKDAGAASIPSADEALAIVNETGHRNSAWKLVVMDIEDNRNELSYEELIGTAMYYKAKGKQGAES